MLVLPSFSKNRLLFSVSLSWNASYKLKSEFVNGHFFASTFPLIGVNSGTSKQNISPQ